MVKPSVRQLEGLAVEVSVSFWENLHWLVLYAWLHLLALRVFKDLVIFKGIYDLQLKVIVTILYQHLCIPGSIIFTSLSLPLCLSLHIRKLFVLPVLLHCIIVVLQV